MKIIALSGVAQAGKSTAAHAIACSLFNQGYDIAMKNFAGPLKRASQELGFIKGSEYDHLYRQFCQMTGAMAREESEDWWVDLMSFELDALAAEEQEKFDNEDWHETVVIIDDLRYMNELALVRKYSGRSVFISASRRLNMDAEFRQHESERLANGYESGEFDDDLFDFTVSNNDSTGEETFISVMKELAGRIVAAREETR